MRIACNPGTLSSIGGDRKNSPATRSSQRAIDSFRKLIYLGSQIHRAKRSGIFARDERHGWGATMAKASTSSDKKKPSEETEGFLADADGGDFEAEEEVAPAKPSQKDPSIRRKIEDRLERKRLRDELGIYDDDAWEDI
jgi:hypothetical protein